jgi:peptidoglycan/xylan/chitin deacetylase (PgdA/CDA1 family)
MWESIAGPSSEHYIAVMKQVEDLFTAIGKWAREHPTAMKVIIGGVAGLGAVIAGLGVAAVITACVALAPAGAVYVAAAALVTIIGSIAAANWDSVKNLFQSILDWVGKMIDKAKEWFSSEKGKWGYYDPTAYHPGGAANDNGSWSDMGQGRVGAAVRDAARRGGWKGYGSSSFGSKGDLVNYIRDSAIRHGVDPDVAVRVAQSEGLSSYVGDHGTSFGPFQLHYGGSGIAGMNSGGLGDVFTRRTGKDARDRSTVKQQIDFALGYAKTHGWRDWHGAARVGIGSHQGLSGRARRAITEGVTPPPRKESQPVIQFDAHLDGEVLSRSVTRRQSRWHMFATSRGDIDPTGGTMIAGTRFSDVG